MRRAVLLARVSTADKGQEPETQLVALRGAARRLEWEVAAELSLKLSAWDDRAAAEVRRRALEPIELGLADTLMVWSWDRFSRRGIESAFRELNHLEHHLGASLWSLQEPFLCTASASPQQRELMLALVSWAAKWESERRSERVRARVDSKRTLAGNLGERARWGGGHLATRGEADQVRAMKTEGWSVRAIAAELHLSKSQVHRLLRPPVPGAQPVHSGASTGTPPPAAADDRDTGTTARTA